MDLKSFVQNEQTHKQNPVCAQYRKGLKKALAQDCEWGGLSYILIPQSLTMGTLLHSTIFPTRRSLPGGCVQSEVAHWHIPCKSLEDWLLSFPGLLRRVLALGPSVSSRFWVLHITSLVSEARLSNQKLCVLCVPLLSYREVTKKKAHFISWTFEKGAVFTQGAVYTKTVTWSVSGTDTRLT